MWKPSGGGLPGGLQEHVVPGDHNGRQRDREKVEQQTLTITEWSAEIDMAEEASKLGW